MLDSRTNCKVQNCRNLHSTLIPQRRLFTRTPCPHFALCSMIGVSVCILSSCSRLVPLGKLKLTTFCILNSGAIFRSHGRFCNLQSGHTRQVTNTATASLQCGDRYTWQRGLIHVAARFHCHCATSPMTKTICRDFRN